jgi:hypothetical protein
MADNTQLAGRLFNFVPSATAKNAANAAASDLRRQLGASAVNIIADISSDLCVPATLAATSSWSSPIIPSAGMTHISFAGKLTQNGNAIINRYADTTGNLLVASTTANVTANAVFQCDVSSTVLFQAFNITMSNSGSSVATVSSYIGLLSK